MRSVFFDLIVLACLFFAIFVFTREQSPTIPDTESTVIPALVVLVDNKLQVYTVEPGPPPESFGERTYFFQKGHHIVHEGQYYRQMGKLVVP